MNVLLRVWKPAFSFSSRLSATVYTTHYASDGLHAIEVNVVKIQFRTYYWIVQFNQLIIWGFWTFRIAFQMKRKTELWWLLDGGHILGVWCYPIEFMHMSIDFGICINTPITQSYTCMTNFNILVVCWVSKTIIKENVY